VTTNQVGTTVTTNQVGTTVTTNQVGTTVTTNQVRTIVGTERVFRTSRLLVGFNVETLAGARLNVAHTCCGTCSSHLPSGTLCDPARAQIGPAIRMIVSWAAFLMCSGESAALLMNSLSVSSASLRIGISAYAMPRPNNTSGMSGSIRLAFL
jgi:hypothetical protein